LNQLIRVDEPNNANQLGTIDAPNLPTKYEYNGLGSLRKVIQGEQTRTFVYDSLNRLRWAINPESGTTTYQYDNNSNLTAKTDARGVSTHYTYDRLNRVIRRSYSGENGYQTPQVDYFYDGVGVSSTSPFAKGKLTKISSAVSTTEYTGFDALGRVLSHKDHRLTKLHHRECL
jgi:YD repeat-containing protein